MRGAKRLAMAESTPDTNDSAFRNKRIMEGSMFDIHRAEPSQQQSVTKQPLDMQRAESSRQHVRALNTQFASWVQTQLKNHPDELWEDGVRDYLAHASNIMEKFSDIVNWLRANAVKAGNSSAAAPHSLENKSLSGIKNTDIKLSQVKTFTPTTSFANTGSFGLFSSSSTAGSTGLFSSNTTSGSSGVLSTNATSGSSGMLYNNAASGSSGLFSNNTASGISGLFSNTGASGSSGLSSNTTPGGALFSSHASAGSSLLSNNSASGSSLFSNSAASGSSLFSNSAASGSSLFSNSAASGSSLFSNSAASASSLFSNSAASGSSLFSNSAASGSSLFSNSAASGSSLFLNSAASGSSLFSNSAASGSSLFSNSAASWSSGVFSSSQTPVLVGNQSSDTKHSNASNDADDEDELPQPSSPSVKKSEEKGIVVVHEVKCKLYVKSIDPDDKGTWKDKGTGKLSIKCKEGISKGTKESKPTIIVRNDVGRVLLNALLYPGIKTNLQKNSIVAIFHTSVDDASAANSHTAVVRTFLIKTKTEEDRNKLATAIQDYAPES